MGFFRSIDESRAASRQAAVDGRTHLLSREELFDAFRIVRTQRDELLALMDDGVFHLS